MSIAEEKVWKENIAMRKYLCYKYIAVHWQGRMRACQSMVKYTQEEML